jgi:hypothetical protein
VPDQTLFWLVIGAFMYQGAYLVFPDTARWRRTTGALLLTASTIVAIVHVHGWPAVPIFAAPSVAEYSGLAMVVAIAFSAMSKLREDLLLKRRAKELGNRIRDYALTRPARFWPYSPAQETAEHRRWRAEYIEKFAVDARRVNQGFVQRGLSHEGIDDAWMGARETSDLDVPTLADLGSRFFINFSRELPRPKAWFDRKFAIAVTGCFLLAEALWVALFVFRK